MKKTFLIGGLVVLGLTILSGGGWWLTHRPQTSTQTPTTEKKKKVSVPVNVIDQALRPFVSVLPTADGKNILISVQSLKKTATEAEYELEYQAGSLLQGAFGTIKLANLPSETKVLLGSCSAGGACTYHTEVQGGTLLMRFAGPEDYALKTDWKYIENKTQETAFSSKDGKFQVSGTQLAKQKLLIISNSPGYPGTPPGTVVSESYILASNDAIKGKFKISLRAKEAGKLKIMGWNGQAWVDFITTPDKDDDKFVSADVELMRVYLVVNEK